MERPFSNAGSVSRQEFKAGSDMRRKGEPYPKEADEPMQYGWDEQNRVAQDFYDEHVVGWES